LKVLDEIAWEFLLRPREMMVVVNRDVWRLNFELLSGSRNGNERVPKEEDIDMLFR